MRQIPTQIEIEVPIDEQVQNADFDDFLENFKIQLTEVLGIPRDLLFGDYR